MHAFDIPSDDFGVIVHLTSKVELPANRETVLGFFEAARRHHPGLTDFERRDGGEFVLEEDREAGSYRWVAVDGRRLTVGFANPPAPDAGDGLACWVLDAAPYHLGVSGLDAESLDVVYYFDFPFAGNHDEVVAEALSAGGPFDSLVQLPGGRVLHHQPAVTVALDDACQLQLRLTVETRTTAYQVRTASYAAAPVSVYATVRQFWARHPHPTFADGFRHQRQVLDELVAAHVRPNVLAPLARTIGARQ